MGVASADERRIELLAQGLPNRTGSQIAVDVILRTVLTACGAPKSRAAVEDGVVAKSARADKAAKYPEIVDSRRCELVVLALETGGR